jgi:leader peptidase (prepilin peptidase) / N-methyltransferase
LTPLPRKRIFYHRRTRLALIWLTVSTLLIGYVVIVASWQASRDAWSSFSDYAIPRAMDALVASWLFFVGSSIGSFLNVVAWRMPRGVSVNGRSHCPRCNSALSWKDNWPVFGWLALGGRCSTCHLPISPRYPIVELLVGLCIFFVGWREFFGGGATLPFHPTRHGYAGSLWTPYLTTDAIVTMTYHIVAIGIAWAFALVRFDGQRLPRSLVLTSLLLIVVPMLAWPSLAVVPWHVTMDESWMAQGKYLDALMRVVTGAAAAVVIGRSLARYLSPTADPKLDPLGKGTGRLMDMIAMLLVPGIVVGWQAALAVTAVASMLAILLGRVSSLKTDALGRLGISLAITLTVQIGLWRILHQWPFWPSVGTLPLVTIGWAAAVLIIPRALRDTPVHPSVSADASAMVADHSDDVSEESSQE